MAILQSTSWCSPVLWLWHAKPRHVWYPSTVSLFISVMTTAQAEYSPMGLLLRSTDPSIYGRCMSHCLGLDFIHCPRRCNSDTLTVTNPRKDSEFKTLHKGHTDISDLCHTQLSTLVHLLPFTDYTVSGFLRSTNSRKHTHTHTYTVHFGPIG